MNKRTWRSKRRDDDEPDSDDGVEPLDIGEGERDDINGYKEDDDEPESLDDLVKLKWND